MNNVEREIREICELVYNRLGYGLSEAAYQRSLEIELQVRNYCCIREYYLCEKYKDSKGREHIISQLRVDILVTDLDCIIELKAIAKLGDKELAQINRYKKISCCKNAYLVNFGKKFEFVSC